MSKSTRRLVPSTSSVPSTTAPAPTAPAETTITADAGPVTLADGRFVVTSPSGDTFTVPCSATLARIGGSLRAMAAGDILPDTPENFRALVARFRDAWDAAGPAADWSKIPGNRSVFGVAVMDTQNAVYAAAVLAGVRLPNHYVMAAWRALVPVTKCDFAVRRYGVSALADLASGRQRPTSIPGVPDGAFTAALHRFYFTDGLSKPWTVAVAPVAE